MFLRDKFKLQTLKGYLNKSPLLKDVYLNGFVTLTKRKEKKLKRDESIVTIYKS